MALHIDMFVATYIMSEIVAVYSHPVGNSSLFFNLNVTYTFKFQ